MTGYVTRADMAADHDGLTVQLFIERGVGARNIYDDMAHLPRREDIPEDIRTALRDWLLGDQP